MAILAAHNMSYKPTQTLAQAPSRAAMHFAIRQFFADKGVMEVTTPILSHAGNTDTFIESVAAHFHQSGKLATGYLHTSPEFAMKRLLAACLASLLVNKISEWQCDLVVMGTHGFSGVKHLLMGSVAQDVIRQAGVPVLILRVAAP